MHFSVNLSVDCIMKLPNHQITNLIMRIISYNVNGLRAAIRRGFLDWLATDPADVICLQEVKAQQCDIDEAAIENAGYKSYWFCAQKKGYSGVALLTKVN